MNYICNTKLSINFLIHEALENI